MLTANQSKLVYWITERDCIRLLKEGNSPKPWSSDPIFQVTYFTNVNREDDKVTKWIRHNWNYRYAEPGVHELAMIIARIFNQPDTLFEIGYPADGNLDEWLWVAEDVLEARKERGEKLWNGAYIISTNGKKMDKLRYCLNLIENLLPLSISGLEEISKYETLEEAHKQLMKVEGLASFLAAQVVADLKNSDGYALREASDWWSFCSHGPGSLRGLSWFWEETVTPKTFHKKIFEAYEILQWELNADILEILCMQNLQNCFCEFDKYMRVLNGTGRSKRKYSGE